ncbi:MAG: hypothetical protein EBU67_03315 [Actinobacteria bacterium]|nr:hypothetical protein [Actinomycetota bacterium]
MTVWGVLAGGRGRRYGEPKASARFGNQTFLQHSLDVVRRSKMVDDVIAVSVARHQTLTLPDDCVAIIDSDIDPGPAHSIGRLAGYANSCERDLVVVAVDMLNLTPTTLSRMRDRLRDQRLTGEFRVSVASSGTRDHWVFVGIPHALTQTVADNAGSVSAIQVLLQLCPIERFPVSAEELLDVNTPDLLPPDRN